MAEDKREQAKPAAGAKPGAPAPGAKPGAPAPASTAVKNELTRRGLDKESTNPDGPEQLVERALRRLGRGSMILAGAVGLFVVVGGILLTWQQSLIRGQLAAMRTVSTQTDQALANAGRLAEAAKKSADAVVDLERAYLLPDAAVTILPKTVAPGSPVRIGFKNYGKTPATLRSVTGHYAYSAGPPARLLPPQSDLPVPMVIGDGGTAGPYDLALDAGDADLDKARQGNGAMVVQALVVYADMFGEQHETAFCFQFQFKTSSFVPCPTAGLDYHS
jgi:hypothetical protein